MNVVPSRFEPQAVSRFKSRRLVYALVGAGGLLLAGLLIWHFAARKPAVIAKPMPSLTVTTAIPHRAVWGETLDSSGAIAAWQEAIIGSQIGGYQLVEVRANVGDQVKKGQLLARFDPDLLGAEAAQLQANYDQAVANEKRAQALKQSGAISEQNVLLAVTTAKTALAQLSAKKLQLRYANVVAPDDGAISSRTATLGAVTPIGQELFRLIRQNRLEWRGELTAAQISQIVIGQAIALTLPDGTQASAKVRQIAPQLDSASRLGTVYADIVPGSHARAGMYADGKVALERSPALVVPAQSVVVRDGRNYVFKLADSSATPRLRMQLVTPGRRQGDEVEILQGISESDRVVAQGAGFLGDNDIVRLTQ